MYRLSLLVFFLFVIFHAIGQPPQIKYTGSTSICAGQSLVLSVEGVMGNSTYNWRKDGMLITPAQTQKTYTVTESGTYDVVVTTGPDAITLDAVKVTVHPNPVSGFSFSQAGLCSNLPITFFNNSTGTALDYSWNFDDPKSGASANVSTARNPVHTFVGNPGNGTTSFTVTLAVADNKGCKDTVKSVITVKQVPGIQLDGTGVTTYNDLPYFTQCNSVPSAFDFTNLSSTSGTNTNYQLKWGDGSADFSATGFTSTSHTYPVGNNKLLFIVTGGNGCKDTATYNVFVGSNPAVGLGTPGNTNICSGTSLEFPISNTASNPPGTVYTVSFNDGTASTSYHHPAPASVIHKFDLGSCGVPNGILQNSFTATIAASNPCGVSLASVVPIYVSTKAKADFSISPKDTTCVGSTVTFSNTGINANSVSGQGICTPGKSVWKIMPATGWSIQSGAVGDDLGSATPSQWTAGSTTLGVVFNTPGVYKIKLKTGGSALCGGDEIEKTICVNPVPVANFTVSQTAGCSPLTVTTVNNSNIPLCGTNVYTWSVSYSSGTGCTPSGSDFAYINGTSANSAAPQFQFKNPGIYTISLVTSNKSSNCSSTSFTRQITVKAKPQVTFTIPSTICQGGSISPLASVNGCNASSAVNYSWTFTGGLPASSSSETPGNVTYNTAGTFNVNLTVTNECGSTSISRQIIINPRPDVLTPGNQVFCAGETISGFSFSSSNPGTSFTWTNSNTTIGLGAGGTGNIPAFTATNTGSGSQVATITVTPSLNGCTGSAKIFTITVHPKPAAPVVTTQLAYCLGETAAALTAGVAPSHTPLWYTSPTGGVGSTTAPIPQTVSAGNFFFYVSQKSTSTGCESTRSLIVVNVKPAPTIASAAPVNPANCATSNGSINLSGLTPNTIYTVHYSKNSVPATVSVAANAGGTIMLTGLSAGTYSGIKVVLNGCPSNEVGPFTLTDPNPPAQPDANSDSPLCSGGTLHLTASTSSTGNIIYSWTGPNGFNSNRQNPVLTSVTTAASGNYTVTTSLNGCSASRSIGVVVNPQPSKPVVDRPVTYCLQSIAPALIAQASTGNTLTWYDNKNLTGGSATAPVPSTAVAGNFYYYVTQENSFGCKSDSAAVPVIIYPALSGNTIGNDQTLCSGNTAAALTTLTPAAGGNGSYHYKWQSSTDNGNTWNDIAAAASETYSPGARQVTAQFRRVVSGGTCSQHTSNVVTITIQGTLDNYEIGSSQTICQGGQPAKLIGALPTGGSGSYSFEWEGSTDKINWNSIAGANGQDFQPPSLNVTTHYRRKVKSGYCSAYSSVVTVTVIKRPVINTVGNFNYCHGSAAGNISFSSVPSGNIVYSWTNDNPAIGLASSGTGNIPSFTSKNTLEVGGLRSPITAKITVTPAFDDGTIHCVGDPVQFTITVLPFITPRPAVHMSLCSGITIPSYIPISGAADYEGSGIIYNWSLNGNSIDLTNGSGTRIPAITTSNSGSTDAISIITLLPVYTLNGLSCTGGPMSYQVNVKPSISNNRISADQTICPLTPAALVEGSDPAGGGGGYKYQWQSSTDGGLNWITIPGAEDIHFDPGIPGVTTLFRRKVSTFLCSGSDGSISNEVKVTINADAKAVFHSAKDAGCAPFVLDADLLRVQEFAQNKIYKWYANGNFIGSSSQFPGYTIGEANDSVLIKLVAESGCKADSTEHAFHTYKVPVPSFTLGETEGCGPLSVVITNTTPDAGLFNYTWDFGNGVTSTSVHPGTVVFAPNSEFRDTNYTITLKVVSACDTITIQKRVKVKSKPKALFAPSLTVGCSPMTVVFNNISGGNGNVYSWDFGDGTFLRANNGGSVTHLFTTAIRDTFFVKLKAVNECGADSMQYAIVVSPNTIKLDFAVNGNEETGCSPQAVRFVNNSQGASNFRWDFGDGNVINTQKNIDTVLHLFQAPGVYVVELKATNGCSDTTSTETITVYPTPRAAFDFSSACLEDSVRFNNRTEGATSYEWQFGDGTVSTLGNPSHRFKNPGTYTVILRAFRFNAPGSVCVDTISRSVQLGPSGNFAYDIDYLCNERAAVFRVESTNTDTLIFKFGDGKELRTTSNMVSHVFTNGGSYLPSVILKNKAGCELVLVGTDSIRVDKVKAGFHASAQQLCGSTIVNFSDTSKAYFGKASVRWNFGDGTTGQGTSVQHTYTVSGNYPVELIVIGNNGCSDTVRQILPVVVHSIPVAAIRMDTVLCTGYQVFFVSDVQSGDAVTLYQWQLSNGVTSDQSTFNYSFLQAGDYTVRLITGTVNGCYDTVVQNLSVNPSPIVKASNDLTLCLGNSAGIQATGSSQLRWLPVEGLSCVTCPDPIVGPQQTTPYVVQGTNGFGCSGYDTVVVTVIQPLQLTISKDDSICIGKSSQLVASGASSYNWSPVQGLSSTTVSNPVATPASTTRYRVVGYDGYNCFTDTAYATVAVGQYPTINLGPDLVLSTGTLQPLRSVIQNGPIRTWDWEPPKDLSCQDCPLPVATIKKDIHYSATITNYYGCTSSDTIQIKVFCENSQVFIANAFTPDSDGINDVLLVQGKGIVQVKSWRIFNRWGELIFERSNFSPNDPAYGWDGKIRGVVGGPDVFVFTAEVICENGTPYSYKGNVSIIK